MRILAIDPGSEKSAWVVFADGKPEASGIYDTKRTIELLYLAMADGDVDHRANVLLQCVSKAVRRHLTLGVAGTRDFRLSTPLPSFHWDRGLFVCISERDGDSEGLPNIRFDSVARAWVFLGADC